MPAALYGMAAASAAGIAGSRVSRLLPLAEAHALARMRRIACRWRRLARAPGSVFLLRARGYALPFYALGHALPPWPSGKDGFESGVGPEDAVAVVKRQG